LARETGWQAGESAVSLMSRLGAWMAPFIPQQHTGNEDVECQRREAEQQVREAARLLRQLRAELKLMQLWKQQPPGDGE
jgi:hypothetical protein